MKYLLWLAILSPPAFAHVPYVEGLDFKEGEAFVSKAPVENSLAVYMNFDAPGDVDEVMFSLTEENLQDEGSLVTVDGVKGRLVSFDSIVPRCSQNQDLLLNIAIVGPVQTNLPSPSLPSSKLPFAVGPSEGIFILRNDGQGEEFKEDIGDTNYWQQAKSELVVTEPGEYHAYIWNDTGKTGAYAFILGRKETFGFAEIVQSIKRISYIRKGKEIKDAACRAEAKNP